MNRRRLAVAGLLAALTAGVPAAAAAEWDRFEIILWHNHGPAALAGARDLGVTAGMALGVRDDPAPERELAGRTAAPRDAGLGYYVENIATDFYATYHRWQPDHPVTWLFDRAQARHAADPADLSVFVREPSLSDPASQSRIDARLAAHVRALGAAPLYYNLADEAGIADLTAAWDFDLSDVSLAAMRVWLREQYGSLAALNAEWGTRFAAWDDVRPMLTDAALRVENGNFAAWADFKAWMDVAFARAVRAGTEAVHRANPAARAGLEGAQGPGWGGYDYTQLADAVDVMEITSDSAQPIAQAMNPALVTLLTLFGDDEAALLWRAVLAGYRGAILWDPDADVVRADGTPGPRGQALAGVLAELGGPLGRRLLAATPRRDPVAILYSPASFRIRWILDRQADAAAGQDWSRRRSETELGDNALRTATRQAADGLAHLSVQPRWLSPAMLVGGALRHDGIRLLILPQALALSDGEVAAIRDFAAAGGTVLADVSPGSYNAHGRHRPALPLDGVATLRPGLPRAALAELLATSGIARDITPGFTLTRPDGTPADDATVRVLRDGQHTILGLQRDATAAGGPAETLVLTLTRPLQIRDLRRGAPVAPVTRTAERRVRVDAADPVLLELSE